MTFVSTISYCYVVLIVIKKHDYTFQMPRNFKSVEIVTLLFESCEVQLCFIGSQFLKIRLTNLKYSITKHHVIVNNIKDKTFFENRIVIKF